MSDRVIQRPVDSNRVSIAIAALATLMTLCLILWPIQSRIAGLLILGLGALLLIWFVRFEYALLIVFALVAWFSEYSQTEWDVWTAEDAPSLYNYRPIPAITASVFDYLFAVVVGAWLWRIVLPEPRRLFRAPLAKWMLAFLAVCMASLVYGLLRGNETYYALREFRVSAYFVLAYLMVVTSVRSEHALRRFVRLGFLLALATGVYGVFRFVMGIGKEFADVRLVYYDIAESMLLYVVMLGMLSAGLAGQVHRRHRALMIAAAVPMLFSFVFSFRRGAWVAFAVGLLFLFVFPPSDSKKRAGFSKIKLGLVTLACFALVLMIADTAPAQFVWERLASIVDTTDDTSNVFRIFDALNALNAFLQNPVFGVGFGGRYELEYFSEEAGPLEFMEHVSRTSHNGYLFILFKMGLIGFVLYMALLTKFFARWYSRRKSIQPVMHPVLFCALGAAFVSILANNVTNPVTDSLRPALLLAFVMGLTSITLACAQQELGLRQRRMATMVNQPPVNGTSR